MRAGAKHAAVLMATAFLLLTAVVTASATIGGAGNSGSSGPSTTDAGGRAAPQVKALDTVTNPVPAFVPSPQAQIYVPVAPCRIVDTRSGGGKLTAGQTRNFAVSGSTGFTAQGGNATGCGIPVWATAVAFNFMALNSTTSSYLTGWAAGAARPVTSVLRFQKGQITNTSETVQIRQNANPALSVYLGAGSADVIVDVYGYYEPQPHLIVLADGTVWYGNATHLTEIIHTTGTGTYTLVYDRSLAGCNVLTTGNGQANVLVSGSWGGSSVTVTTELLSGSTLTAHDEGFQLFLIC
jgi:hypothetical protein